MLIGLNQGDTHWGRDKRLALLEGIITLLDCFDVLMDRGISANSILVHLGDKI